MTVMDTGDPVVVDLTGGALHDSGSHSLWIVEGPGVFVN